MTRPIRTMILSSLLLATSSPAWGQLIVAHRGASAEAPENTLAAFELAWQLGADAVEGDFYLTKDGHVVCIHDKTTKRTAGTDLPVMNTDLATLQRLDVGRFKGARWAGQRIPTLPEVLGSVPDGKRIVIEVKDGPRIVPFLVRDLKQTEFDHNRVIVIAFDANVIVETKRLLPDVKALWLVGSKRDKVTRRYKPTHASILKTLDQIKAEGLDMRADPEFITPDFVKRLNDVGAELHVWTVNDPAVAHHFRSLGVESITTDIPGQLRRHLAATPESNQPRSAGGK